MGWLAGRWPGGVGAVEFRLASTLTAVLRFHSCFCPSLLRKAVNSPRGSRGQVPCVNVKIYLFSVLKYVISPQCAHGSLEDPKSVTHHKLMHAASERVLSDTRTILEENVQDQGERLARGGGGPGAGHLSPGHATEQENRYPQCFCVPPIGTRCAGRDSVCRTMSADLSRVLGRRLTASPTQLRLGRRRGRGGSTLVFLCQSEDVFDPGSP